MSNKTQNWFQKEACTKDIKKWSYIFHTLGDEIRLHIIAQIINKPGISAKEILINLKLRQPTLSFHLKHLNKSKIIVYKKEGTTHNYYINVPMIAEYHKQMKMAHDYLCNEIETVLAKK